MPRRTKSVQLYERTHYLPLYLIDDKPPHATGEVSLFVRRFRLIRTPKGRLVLKVASDVWTFDSTEQMVATIQQQQLRPLPREADGDPFYVPPRLRRHNARVDREYVRLDQPEVHRAAA